MLNLHVNSSPPATFKALLSKVYSPSRRLSVTLLSSCAFLASASLSWVNAEEAELTDSDRVVILERIAELEATSEARVTGLYLKAIAAYKSAVQSDTETMKFYLACYEKVNYTDKGLSNSDFRDWKKRNDAKLSAKSYRAALRMQLAWLLLSLEAASEEVEVTEMSSKALSHLNNLFSDKDVITEQRSLISQNAMSSVFAKTYSLNIKVADWPRSALDIDGIYDKLVMPPLRSGRRIPELRAAWGRKILSLAKLTELQPSRGRTSGSSSVNEVAMLAFKTNVHPQLVWDMEKECYEAGDERAAALNMLKHVEANITHKSAPKWLGEFQAYMDPVDFTPDVQ